MKKYLNLLIFLSIGLTLSAQKKHSSAETQYPTKPKLVVGIIVDQMKFNYLNRYESRFGKGGFNRLKNQGINCLNGYYSFVPTVTAAGHAAVFTGTVPAINGIVGNDWIDPKTGQRIYCVEDKSVKSIGADDAEGEMSPKNLWSSTISDQLKLSQDFHSKTIAVAIKDRGSILAGGHTSDASYWYSSKIGGWISSSYYMQKLPDWVEKINAGHPIEKYLTKPWETLYPLETYRKAAPDNNSFEGILPGNKDSGFPHELTVGGRKELTILTSPFGNSLVKDFAIEALKNENLGKGESTDFLAISFSSTDYVGHNFGPHSIEIEDTYLRLDRDIEEILRQLDETLGKENYLVFLSTDHAIADNPNYLKEHNLDGGTLNSFEITNKLKGDLKKEFGDVDLLIGLENSQIYLNHLVIEKAGIEPEKIEKKLSESLSELTGFSRLINLKNIGTENLPNEILEKIKNGYHPLRSGDYMILFHPQYFFGGKVGANHGSMYEYDSHVPILFYGWKIPSMNYLERVNIQDISASIASWIKIDAPNGSIGKPLNIEIK